MAFLRGGIQHALGEAMLRMNNDELYVLLQVANKLVGKGRAEYGPLTLDTDGRDFLAEAAQELVDYVAYKAMHEAKERK